MEEESKKLCESDRYEKFVRILMKTDYEVHTELVFHELQYLATEETQDEQQKEWLLKSLETAEALLTLKTSDSLTIKICSENNLSSVNRNKGLMGNIESAIEDEYIKEGLNQRYISLKEAEDYLETEENEPSAIQDWINDYFFGLGIGYEELSVLTDEDKESFMLDEQGARMMEVSVTEEEIRRKIESLNDELKTLCKKGAKKKNTKLEEEVMIFLRLCKPSNRNLKTIYDSLDFFGFIPKELKEQWSKAGTKYAEIQYIKSIIRGIERGGIKFHYY